MAPVILTTRESEHNNKLRGRGGMGKKLAEFCAKAVILVLVLFCGIYHQEIKHSIDAFLGKEEQANVAKTQDGIERENIDKQRLEDVFGDMFISSEVSGYKVVKNYGYSCVWFTYSGHADAYSEGFNASQDRLRAYLKPDEANAFINMRIFSSTFEKQGSQWNSALVNMCADMVRVEPL